MRDAVETVLRLLPESEPMSFRALVAGVPTTGSRSIVRFLAVLELYKQGVVDLAQFTNFGELLVRRLQRGRDRARRRRASTTGTTTPADRRPRVDRDRRREVRAVNEPGSA